MPARSEPVDVLRIGRPEDVADALTRSHVADGRCVGWYGDPDVVIDVELADQPVPVALAARYGAESFWERWTRTECAAKAEDVPIARWLRRYGLGAPCADDSWTVVVAGLVISGVVRGAQPSSP